MVGYATVGNTWGVSGPDFLALYITIGVIALVASVVLRRRALLGPDDGCPPTDLSPHEVAYVAGGPLLATTAALGALRAHQAIGTEGSGVLAATGPLPLGASRLDHAVHQAVASGRARSARSVPQDAAVQDALAELEDRLERAGLLVGRAVRRQLWGARLPLLGLLALGLLRFWAGSSAGHPSDYLLLLLLGFGAAAFLLGRTPQLTRRGRRALRLLRAQYDHLNPSSSPAWELYGPAGAAMAVGLFGGAALWAADPAFAAEAQLNQLRATGSGSSSSSCGAGSSCGSSSSCSGGSSCGGGGCGGGGCGG